MGRSAALGIQRRGALVVMGEFEDHAIGIGDIERPAIAVLEHIGLRFDQPCGGNPALKLGLGRAIDIERDMAERAGRKVRAKFGLVRSIGEREEGQRTAIGEAEEAVAIGPLGSE